MNEEPTEKEKDDTIEDLRLKLAFADFEKRLLVNSDDRYAKKIIERVVFAVIVIFAMAALFFIFTKVGLPQPSL